jgi:hypothetical protein
MRKINDVQHTIDQRQARGYERVDTTDQKAVDRGRAEDRQVQIYSPGLKSLQAPGLPFRRAGCSDWLD